MYAIIALSFLLNIDVPISLYFHVSRNSFYFHFNFFNNHSAACFSFRSICNFSIVLVDFQFYFLEGWQNIWYDFNFLKFTEIGFLVCYPVYPENVPCNFENNVKSFKAAKWNFSKCLAGPSVLQYGSIVTCLFSFSVQIIYLLKTVEC